MILSEYLALYDIMTDTAAASIPYLGINNKNLVKQIMQLKYNKRDMYFDSAATLQSDVQAAVLTVFNMHDYNWTHKYATIQVQYNPLNATDYSRSKTDTNSGKDTVVNTGTVKNNGTDTPNTTTADYNRTYDDNTLTETDYSITTGTNGTENTQTNNLNQDTQFGHVLNTSETVTGRDNMTAQELIEKERAVAEYNFYEMIADEITDFICLYSYNYSSLNATESKAL